MCKSQKREIKLPRNIMVLQYTNQVVYNFQWNGSDRLKHSENLLWLGANDN